MPKFVLLFILLLSFTVYANDTALIEAIENGDLEEVSSLIEGGADVNVKDKDGQTALTIATELYNTFSKYGTPIEYGVYADIMKLLKEAGAKE